ncbi:RraA family protein [Xenophilus arseniciresistens]|uniref:Putative 4-hydroxy-4-methyl-2-oxoglutarate aldolase n=1 Tax=Xenophilus arseniciresistens TaxID=1283306 RepID=A0AAE3N5P1_9BURK|nr:RraA family protein [Xenophilus arseniciresistens]MDA7416035.1 RraA family protein [Xenophilus arseniciresistens]
MTPIQILRRRRQVPADVVERFRGLPVANISDCMARIVAAGPRLRPMHAGGALCGPAFTVKTRPGDNLLVHKALDLAEPGDVLVVDAGGDLTNAIMGELMTGYAASRGIAGVVINGAIRDADTLRASPFPVYAAGITHRGPYKDGPGQINVAVAIDGMVIEAGDLIVGDADGVLCVPFDDAPALCEAAREKHAQEIVTLAEIEAGRLDTGWVDALLQRLGAQSEYAQPSGQTLAKP